MSDIHDRSGGYGSGDASAHARRSLTWRRPYRRPKIDRGRCIPSFGNRPGEPA